MTRRGRHRSRAVVWARRCRRLTAMHRRGVTAPRATLVIVSGAEFSIRVAVVPCAGCGEVVELPHGTRSRRAFAVAATGIGNGHGPRGRVRDWWADE